MKTRISQLSMRWLILPSVILILILNCHLNLHAQSNHVDIVDSLYWAKSYKDVVAYADKHLSQSQLTEYNTLGMMLYRSNSLYRLDGFQEANLQIKEAYDIVNQSELQDSAMVRVAIDICQKIGDFSFTTEEYQYGVDAMDKGLSLISKHLPDEYWRMAKLCHKNGAVLRIKGDLKKSKEMLELGLSIVDSLPEAKANYIGPVFQSEIAGWYNYNHQPKKAISIYKEMIAVAEQDSNYKRLSIYNNNISNSYERMHDHGRALYYMQKSLEAKLEIYPADHAYIIGTYNNMATIHMENGDYNAAEQYHEKVLELINKSLSPDNVRISNVEIARGKALLKLGEYKKAIPHLKKTISLRENKGIKDDIEIASAYQLLGYAQMHTGDYPEAEFSLMSAIQKREYTELNVDYERYSSYLFLHDLYQRKGNNDQSSEYLQKAFDEISLDLSEEVKYEQFSIPSKLVNVFKYKLYDLSSKIDAESPTKEEGQIVIEQAEKLIQFLRYSIDDTESKATLAREIQPLRFAIIDYYVKAYEQSADIKHLHSLFQANEAANNIFLYENLAEDGHSKFGVAQEVIDKKEKLLTSFNDQKELINEQVNEDSESMDNYNNALILLNKKKQELYQHIDYIKDQYPEYYEYQYNFPTSSINSVQATLEDNETVIQYIAGTKQLYVLLVDNNTIRFKKIGDKNSIVESSVSLISSIQKKNKFETDAVHLYKVLISPLELPDSSLLHIVPSGELGTLPFEVLINPTNNNFLLHEHVISYQYSSTLMLRAEGFSSRSKNVLAMAPIFANHISSSSELITNSGATRGGTSLHLPASANEIKAIGNHVDTKSFLNDQATIENFKKFAPNSSVIHLATHGFINNQNPNLSRLLFASTEGSQEVASLYSDEIINLDLGADLLTLSACNTGVGKILKGEGVSSLGRAFVYAGCPNQVISLWSVNDQTTTQLMSDFYANLGNNISKPEALRNSKIEYINTSPEAFRHPYYWAGFVYYGNNLELQNVGYKYSFWLVAGCCIILFLLVFRLYKRTTK